MSEENPYLDLPKITPSVPVSGSNNPYLSLPKLKEEEAAPPSYFSRAKNELSQTFSDVPHQIYQAGSDALQSINNNLNPFSEARQQRMIEESKAPLSERIGMGLSDIGGVGSGLMAAPALVGAPITGTARSVIGHPYAALTGEPFKQAAESVDTAMMGISPSRGGLTSLKNPVPLPKPMPPVLLTEGQETGDLAKTQTENKARSGQLGPEAQQHALAFDAQQAGQNRQYQSDIGKSLAPGQLPVNTAPEAGAVVGQGVQREAAAAKQAVDDAYKNARSQSGEFHPFTFMGMGESIKQDLFHAPTPVIVDDTITPNASRALQYLDKQIANLSIQNRAAPQHIPGISQVNGIDLNSMDQIRKTLATFRKNANMAGSDNPDGRAMSEILNSFDDRITAAVNNGSFTGDPLAIQAWNDARAAHLDYRSRFTGASNDPVGRVLDKITGRNSKLVLTPEAVADFLYGSSGINPNSLNVGVATRVRQIFGTNSPEWRAVKQGLFARAVEPSPGMTPFGPGKIAQRLNELLNGKGKSMASTVWNANERAAIQAFADLQRQLEPPRMGVNWSGTSSFSSPMVKKVSQAIFAAIGGLLAHKFMSAIPGVGEFALDAAGMLAGYKGPEALENMQNAKMIAKQMPMVTDRLKQWQKAMNAYNKARSPMNHILLKAASINLARSLQVMGVDITSGDEKQ